jgi:hypothetical protein
MSNARTDVSLGFDAGTVRIRLAGEVLPVTFRTVGVEVYTESGEPTRAWSNYAAVKQLSAGEFVANGSVEVTPARFEIEDRWTCDGVTVRVARTVRVVGGLSGAGFASLFQGELASAAGWDQAELFAPGMWYGRPGAINPASIGGTDSIGAGVRELMMREDRLPMPVVGARVASGLSMWLLHADPDGRTTLADSADLGAERVLIDARFGFSSLGAANTAGGVSLAFCHPGCEGEITYRGDTYPGGQLRKWRRRYHPVADGATQHYTLELGFAQGIDFPSLLRSAWRTGWRRLEPRVQHQDLDAARNCIVQTLLDLVTTNAGSTGIPLAVDAVSEKVYDDFHLMGFTGRNTDAAHLMLHEAQRGHPEAAALRTKAIAILNDFTRLGMNPPEAEGFDREKPMVFSYLGLSGILYLRSLAEGALSVLKAFRLEHSHGRVREGWRTWAVDFGRWLLAKQNADGSFARGFHAGTGEVANAAPYSGYAAIELLTLLADETGEPAFLDAALRCGNFAWEHGQREGRFVGGTIDNPDVADKEAATISLTAYLALFEATRDKLWLERARLAADCAETWIYAWEVPMPVDAAADKLQWAAGATTVGLQLISTGHSLADQYMAFDVGSYRRLARYTGDDHYHEVADILLHNTKAMLSLPSRTLGLARPGWQQEHWSLAPPRGIGLHRLWLPWVTVSHLQGMIDDEAARAM